MAVLRIPDDKITLTVPAEITARLDAVGVSFARWTPAHPVAADASPEAILAAYAAEIEALKAMGGYVTADVIDIKPDTPNLAAMLARFSREHWHDEDEVRFIIAGHGLFHLHPPGRPVMAVQVEPGDLLRLPRGLWHWFDLCGDRRVRAIRLFQDAAGWTPHYTDSGAEKGPEPVCLGVHYVPLATPSA